MLHWLFENLGIDYQQWRALTGVSIKLDFRAPGLEGSLRQRSKRGGSAIFFLLFFHSFMGLMLSPLVWLNKDVFLTGTIYLTWVMFMMAALVLIEYHAVVISPDDSILGPLPVSSRTYFFSKLANVLFYVSLLTTAMGLAPMISYFFAFGFNPMLGVAAVVATYLCANGVALVMIVLYAGIVRWVHPRKVRRALSYLQLVMSFMIYGGYTIVPRLLNRKALASMSSFHKSYWLLLHPATWFASYLDLAVGHWGLGEIGPAILSLAALALLLFYADKRLSLDYSEQLATLSSLTEGKNRASSVLLKQSTFFKRYEGRAISLLIRNQFKFDQRFRLAVLGILPLTIFYLILGLRAGPLLDPFVHPRFDFERGGLLYLAVMLFPLILKTNLATSDSYQASWIFYATPASKERLVLETKNFVLVYFVLPYLAVIAAVFGYYFRNLLHVLAHVALLALLAHIVLQVAVLLNPELPFSKPVRKGERSSRILMAFFGPLLILMLLYFLLRRVYADPQLFAAALGGLAAASLLLERAIMRRVRKLTRKLQFLG